MGEGESHVHREMEQRDIEKETEMETEREKRNLKRKLTRPKLSQKDFRVAYAEARGFFQIWGDWGLRVRFEDLKS